MPLYRLNGKAPQVHPDAFVAPTAILVGDVVVEAHASIWYGVVLRADLGQIIIREGANVQDNSVIHGDTDPATVIGSGATVAHLCVVHGSVVGTEALIGNGSTVQDGCVIGDRAFVAAGSLVTPNTVIPDGMMAMGSPAKVRGPLSETAQFYVAVNPQGYRDLAALHKGTLEEL